MGCPPAGCRAPATACSRPPSRASSRIPARRWRWTGRTWSRFPGPAARHQRLRRPRGVLGAPQEQPAAQRGRAVLRLLPVRRGHDGRGERAGRPRVRPPRRAVVGPARPGPRLRPRAGRDARPGIPLGDILADCGYAHRDAGAWAVPLRAAGARLVQDLHPHDRGPKGTHEGAIISNGNLYCPGAPRPLLELEPLARTATKDQAADHDRKTSELARHMLGRLTADDQDGYPACGAPPRRARSAARSGPRR